MFLHSFVQQAPLCVFSSCEVVFSSGAEQFYPSADTLIQGSHYPTTSALDKMADNAKGMYVISHVSHFFCLL